MSLPRFSSRTADRPMNLRWDLIFPLAAFGLVRPLLSIFGVFKHFEGPWLPILVTIAIAAVWVGVVAIRPVPKPFITLVFVSGLYGVFAIVLQQIMWNFFLENAPTSLPAIAYASIILTNTIWGAVLGVVAVGVRRLSQIRRHTP